VYCPNRRLHPRLPGRSSSDQIITLPGDDIRAMPDDATGAGYEVRRPDGGVVERGLGRGEAKARAEGTDLKVRPQSDLPGYEFLTGEAESGTVQLRPSESRTPELGFRRTLVGLKPRPKTAAHRPLGFQTDPRGVEANHTITLASSRPPVSDGPSWG